MCLDIYHLTLQRHSMVWYVMNLTVILNYLCNIINPVKSLITFHTLKTRERLPPIATPFEQHVAYQIQTLSLAHHVLMETLNDSKALFKRC